MPIQIEVKDRDIPEAATKTADLIRKYKRHQTTPVGGEHTSLTEHLLRYDPNLCTFFGMQDVIKLTVGFFTGLLPYLHFEREVAALPYMTRDFIKMKYEERSIQGTTWGKWTFFTVYIYVG